MSEQRYWGIYFPQMKQWYKETHGRIIFYPSKYIAQAQAQEYIDGWHGTDFERPVVREFDESVVEGQQLRVAK